MLIVVGVSMLAAPVVARLGQSLGDAIDRRIATQEPEGEDTGIGELYGHVIIAGYGRVGQLVGQMLDQQGVRYVAIENNAQLVAHQRKAGTPLVFGDASRPELLRKLRIDEARAVVLTMDHTAAAIHAVHAVRRMVPMMRIIARARDEKHALLLREAGASVVVPETLESSLKLTSWVLETLGVPPEAALRQLEQERERRILALRDCCTPGP
jgi:CPA2 family monovalent cation:H+ antiporter-2